MDQTKLYADLWGYEHNLEYDVGQAFGHKFVFESASRFPRTTASNSDLDWDLQQSIVNDKFKIWTTKIRTSKSSFGHQKDM